LWKKLKLDDACEASCLHMGIGTYGALIGTGFFANGIHATGVFWGSGYLLGWNIAALLAVAAWVLVTTSLAMFFLKCIGLLRISDIDEERGMDYDPLDQEIIVNELEHEEKIIVNQYCIKKIEKRT